MKFLQELDFKLCLVKSCNLEKSFKPKIQEVLELLKKVLQFLYEWRVKWLGINFDSEENYLQRWIEGLAISLRK